MALAKFDYKKEHSRAFYNQKGQVKWSHSEEDELRVKEEGYTTPNYVRSEWPKQVCHKKTGATKVVGKLENTDEQNMAAVAALGPDWTLGHVPVPEPVAEAKPGAAQDAQTAMLLSMMSAQMAEMKKRMDEQEQALIDMATKPEPELVGVGAADDAGRKKK